MECLVREQRSNGQSLDPPVACYSNSTARDSDRLHAVEAVLAGMRLAFSRGHLVRQVDLQAYRFEDQLGVLGCHLAEFVRYVRLSVHYDLVVRRISGLGDLYQHHISWEIGVESVL